MTYDDKPAPTGRTEITGSDAQKADLFGALAKVQAELESVAKSRAVNTGKYQFTYTPFDQIVDAVRKPLSENSLFFSQMPFGCINGAVHVATLLGHASGGYLRFTASIPAENNTAQKIGSAITYIKRYSLASVLGIASEEDDDGAAASSPGRSRAQTKKVDPRVGTMLRAYRDMLGVQKDQVEQLVRTRFEVSLDDMTDEHHEAMRELHEQIQSNANPRAAVREVFGASAGERMDRAMEDGELFGGGE